MVHTGKPSQACETCRKRRIKCDQRIPQCSQCERKNLSCPGYRDQFDVAWRDQTRVAERSVQRRKRATEKGDRVTVASTHLQTRILPSLREHQEDHALCFFFTTYVLVPREPDTCRGYLECLESIYTNVQTKSPAIFATAAVAITMLEAWTKKGTDTPMSRVSYLRAISAVRERVEQQRDYSVEELLLSILLLDFYEGLISVVKSGRPPGTHLKGALALVKHCKPGSFKTEVSQRLLMALRSRLIEYSLQTHQPVPDDVPRWSEIVKDFPQNAALRLDTINIDVANLQALISKTLQPGACGPIDLNQKIVRILGCSRETDMQLAKWSETLPPSFTIMRISSHESIPESVRKAGLYQNHCDIYNSIFVASVWNSYRCSRIKVQSVILRCLSQLNRPQDSNNTNLNPTITPAHEPIDSPPALDPAAGATAAAKSTIQIVLDDICASIPFYLGNRITPSWLDDASTTFPHTPFSASSQSSRGSHAHPRHHPLLQQSLNQSSSFLPHQTPKPQSGPCLPNTPQPSSSSANSDPIATDVYSSQSMSFPSPSPYHYRIAAASGGWFLIANLYSCLAPGVPMREGQREWIFGQVGRIGRIYKITR